MFFVNSHQPCSTKEFKSQVQALILNEETLLHLNQFYCKWKAFAAEVLWWIFVVSFCPEWSSLSERWVLSGTKFFFPVKILIVLLSGVSGDHSGRPKVEGQWFNLLLLQCQTVFRQDVDDQVAPSLFLLICLKLWFLELNTWTNLLNWLSFFFEVQIERSRRVFPGCNGRVVKALDLKSNGGFPT